MGYNHNKNHRFSKAILTLVASLMLLCSASEALADWASTPPTRHPGGGHRPPPNNPSYPGQPGGGVGEQSIYRREAFVNRYVRDEYLDLFRLVNIDYYRDRGLEIERVEVQASNNNAGSEFSLFADGMPVARSYVMPWTTLIPNRHLQIGYNLSRAELHVRGKVFVQRVTVILRQDSYPPQPQPPYPPQPNPPGQNQIVLEVPLWRLIYGPAQFEIGQTVNLYRYQGYQISAIDIEGSTIYGNMVQAAILVNSQNVGQVGIQPVTTFQTIYPRQALIIGRNVGAVQLWVDGHVNMNRIRFKLTRF